MPANVKTERDEAAWERAKAATRSQYPKLTEENDRFWAITQHIYGNMKALDAMDLIDQDDDAEIHKAIVVLVRRQHDHVSTAIVLSKAYVKAHQRKLPSGRVVTIPAYFTKVVGKPDAPPAKKRSPKHAPPAGVHTGLSPEQLAHRLVRHVQEGTLTHEEAEANVAHLERRAHKGHGLQHGHGPAWEAHHVHEFVTHARAKLAAHKADQARKVEDEERLQQEEMRQHQATQAKRATEEVYGEQRYTFEVRPGSPGYVFATGADGTKYEVYLQHGAVEPRIEDAAERAALVAAARAYKPPPPQPPKERDRSRDIPDVRAEMERQGFGERAERHAVRQEETPSGQHRPPPGITTQERQQAWDKRMRERQQAEREKPRAEEKKPPGGEDIHYEQYKRMIPKLGQAVAVQRAGSALASHVLSREMGETIEAFARRSPRYRGLKRFLDEHATEQRQAEREKPQEKPAAQEKPQQVQPAWDEASERRIALAVKNLQSVLRSRSVTPAMIESRIQGLEQMAQTGKRLWRGYTKDDVLEIAHRLRQAFPTQPPQAKPSQTPWQQQERQLRGQARGKFQQAYQERHGSVGKSRRMVLCLRLS